jgi:disulfide bond formation protein DsbB
MAEYVNQINYTLSLFTVLGDVAVVVVTLGLITRRFGTRITVFDDLFAWIAPHAVRGAFIVASAGVILSLYYSDIVGYAPCALCWWQRIFLYPQIAILGVALFKNDRDIIMPGIILSGFGIVFAAYNTFLQFGGTPFVPCGADAVSCAQRYFLEFGYVTIPTMSLTAFAFILTLLLVRRTTDRR